MNKRIVLTVKDLRTLLDLLEIDAGTEIDKDDLAGLSTRLDRRYVARKLELLLARK